MRSWKAAGRKRRRMGRGIKLFLFAACIIAILIMAENQLGPVVEAKAVQKVNNLALAELAESINRQIAVYKEAGNYQSLMHIERDHEGRIVLMAADTLLINSLVTALIVDIEDNMNELAEQEIQIPLMAVTGSKLFSSIGPDLPVRITGIATPQIYLEDSFVAAGINQIKHSIYIEAEVKLQVTVPFNQDITTISTEVLLAEGIIIGNIPDTFVQFDTSN